MRLPNLPKKLPLSLARWKPHIQRINLHAHRTWLRLVSPVQNLDRLLQKAAQPGSCTNISLHLLRRKLGDDLYLNIPARALTLCIRRLTNPVAPRDHVLGYFILDEDWQKYHQDIRKTFIYEETAALVQNPEAIRESAWYKKTLANIAAGRYMLRHRKLLTTQEALDDYLNLCGKLLASVRAKGLLRLSGLDAEQRNAYQGATRQSSWEDAEVDLGLAVNAAGDVYRTADGQHRGALAVILNLPSIPVELRLTRRDWLRAALAKRPDLRPTDALRLAIRDLESDLQSKFGR